MYNTGIRLMIAALTLSFVLPVMAQNDVFLTLDPDSNMPTVVANAESSAPIRFKSMNYLDEENPVPFFLQFGPEFDGMFNEGAGFTDATKTSFGVLFSSEHKVNCVVTGGPNMTCQIVTIKLKNSADVAHPPQGYKYAVVMGTKVLDPRVVPH
jgi:hypothetical protein